MKTKVMEVITYKKQTSKTKYIIEAALEYRSLLNISRIFFQKKKKAAASIQENAVPLELRYFFIKNLIQYKTGLKHVITLPLHQRYFFLFSYSCIIFFGQK